jgi:hypothetical protein
MGAQRVDVFVELLGVRSMFGRIERPLLQLCVGAAVAVWGLLSHKRGFRKPAKRG